MKPLRNLVVVERLPPKGVRRVGNDYVTDGGIVIPQAFRRQHPTDKHKVQPDVWRGRVEAIGPDVRELSPGDEVLIHTWAEHGRGLYTGVDAVSGGNAGPLSKRVILEYPDDFICALEETGPEAA